MDDFGLMFYNARWYDPTIGRFVQADSIVPGGVQGYDRYAYVGNNPVAYSDPSGHFAMLITALAGAGIGAAVGAAAVALPQMVKNVQAHEPLTANINPTELGKAAAAGAVAGAIGGLTFGVGTAVMGTGLAGSVFAGSLSGVIAGQAGRATSNVLDQRSATEGLGNVGDMATDAALGAAGGALGYGISRLSGPTTGRAAIAELCQMCTQAKGAGPNILTAPEGENPVNWFSRIIGGSEPTPFQINQGTGMIGNVPGGGEAILRLQTSSNPAISFRDVPGIPRDLKIHFPIDY